ncbi:CDP-diacylglycerol--glycerol-3-phosphate 3-phosphatidyltransferase [Candidatus Pelagisphaera phototrophica]|uniref:CDP-diacylglycerol--glycerol-3-phosphate 3-phosphatidyltransferase n=1 Tax=Candidatus Pelagisphaera phototrophica TaxID=2684113 RepID=UPI001A0D6EC7|nr:CDP-diacylglycerol--glycerol-3-phosphate 3-phosphatidyltransferase [Candidatus Pelagisphaera phototrophica]QXD31484.1 CDP-diacylglycerol--glycerol-3-phosphate 3-phosphatidyltransferase [Candidatus Pelagisphaera phototrophica]
MNLPNILTLSRIPLMFLIVWLMREDFMWAATGAFVMFVIAGLTDWLDGYVARKQGIVSNFGILMDALTDKILMLGLMIALVDIGQVHIFLVLLILGREFMITGMRLVAATKGVVVSAESSGKQKTVTQILAVGAFLLEAVFRKDFGSGTGGWAVQTAETLNWIGLILFGLCVFMTLYSGANYFKKYGELVFLEGDR